MSVDRLLRRFKRRRSLRILLAALALYLLVRLGAFGNQHSTEGWISGAPDMPIIGVSQPASGRVPDAPLSGALARLRTKGDPETKAGEHEIKGGFLFVNMDLPASQHPIRQLIGAGKAAWESKLKRQSKTLKQAVREYKRRHGGRNPPKGFDKWWAYREKHNVQLPDEYDRITRDLEPFRGLSSAALRARVDHLRGLRETCTLSVRDGKLRMYPNEYGTLMGPERVEGQYNLIKDVAKFIPDFDAVLYVHDTPTQFISHNHLMELQRAADDGEPLEDADEGDRSFSNWGSACPPGSALRELHQAKARNPENFNPDYKDAEEVADDDTIFVGWKPPRKFTKAELDHPSSSLQSGQKTFVWSQEGMMDLCANPDSIRLHGALNGLHPIASPRLMPIFSLSKTTLHSDITVIPTEQWIVERPSTARAWENKTDHRLLWRGRNTGGWASKHLPWRSAHRPRLARMAFDNLTDSVDVLPPPTWGATGGQKLKDVVLERVHGELNQNLLDVGLAYEPIQCSHSDGTCAQLKKELKYSNSLTFAEEINYRYILDIDGNAWSARFQRLFMTRSLVVKNSIYPEWFNDRIQPWVHFVPAKLDYSDLYDIMSFFEGDGRSKPGEEALAQEIAHAGGEWVRSFWRQEDMTTYMFRLYLEWARLLAEDRDSMDFIL